MYLCWLRPWKKKNSKANVSAFWKTLLTCQSSTYIVDFATLRINACPLKCTAKRHPSTRFVGQCRCKQETGKETAVVLFDSLAMVDA